MSSKPSAKSGTSKTIHTRKPKAAAAAGTPKKETAARDKKEVAFEPAVIVDSTHSAPEAGGLLNESAQAQSQATAKEKIVNLTLKGLDKRGRNAIYTGAAVRLRFPIGAFPDKTAPPSIEVGGVAGPKEPKAQMTAEERKAARAAQPKLTLAEKVQRAEERAAKLREKLAAAGATA
jgi:hypothetical protein